ncbi:dihydrofolate reductase [Paenibacillus lemnae]|uniref:Dihydrofolate reductase n=1 Tax=Paenibacillus lemnae TaxID=1330551 RepID=A0A848M5A4_PAELE|nr:dihydrofolate reductase [Paenibacillus lemnae]NMO95935.1 dihydrofolate reductase [Paenibacillus lemnae]
MSISMIWAMDRNGLIGKNNDIPWRLPRDMAYFKQKTLNKTILMGRKTWDSFGGKPLRNRTNIVLTRDPHFQLNQDQGIVIHDLDHVDDFAKDEELMIIGGSQIYEQMLSRSDRLYVTFIDEAFEGDSYFPEVDWEQWTCVSEEQGINDEKNPYPYRFVVYERKTKAHS